MKKLFYLLPLFLLLLLTACENTSGPRFDGDVFTVAGLLVAGQRVDAEHPIYVTRSASIDDFDPLQLFVMDANVKIIDLADSSEIILIPMLDAMRIKYTDPIETLIQPEHTYRIEVEVPGYDKLIWAETSVPQSVTPAPDPWGTDLPGTGFSTDPETANTTPYSQLDAQYPLVLNTGSTQGNYYFSGEVYCLEEFSTDLEFTTTVFGISHLSEDMEDAYNSGQLGFRRINFLNRFSSAPHNGSADNYLVIGNLSFFFALYGKYRVTAMITDENYYRYSSMDEGYLHGGVHNALGYFGSASGGVLYTRIVKD
jgi:hypothetical protein